MYIKSLKLTGIRTFEVGEVEFLYPGREASEALPKPALPNVNLLLGDNGSGKSTLLRAIAISAMGPAISVANLQNEHFVRRVPGGGKVTADMVEKGTLEATFVLDPQDQAEGAPSFPPEILTRHEVLPLSNEVEECRYLGPHDDTWRPGYDSRSKAFFMAAYGATRRVETRDTGDPATRSSSQLARAERVRSIFEEAYSLVPLASWLPKVETEDPARFREVKDLINALLVPTGYRFPGAQSFNDYVFSGKGPHIPFRALSDGYRAFLGWVGDLLYHLHYTCPKGQKIADTRGVVLIDELDLHLHPRWQMKVLPTLAKTFPRLQFIVTSHSPLVVGSLEWPNILRTELGKGYRSVAARIPDPVNGLDADQILLSDFFGLTTTIQSTRERRLKELSLKASEI